MARLLLTLRTASMTLSSFEHHSHAPARGACARRSGPVALFDLASVRVSTGSRRALIVQRWPSKQFNAPSVFSMSVIFVWPQPCLAVAFVGCSSAATAAAPSACHRIDDVLTCRPSGIGVRPSSNRSSDRQVSGSAPLEQLPGSAAELPTSREHPV